MTGHQLTQLQSTSKVGWGPVTTYITIDGVVVDRFGLDHNMNRYYQTVDGHIYQKQSDGWMQIA